MRNPDSVHYVTPWVSRVPPRPDHILASGSLPPGFPMTVIDGVPYWGADGDGAVEFSLLERFHGDGEHRRYVAICSELSAQLTPRVCWTGGVGLRRDTGK